MAFQDSLTQLAAAQAITATAAGTAVFDVANVGSGTVPPMITGINFSTGAAVPIGFDIGGGDGFAIPEVVWNVTTAFSSAASSNLSIALQAAPDNGSGSAGTYQTIAQTGTMTSGQLVANTQGQFQVPPVGANWVGAALPRFYRLNFVVGNSSFSTGNISASILLNPSQAAKIQDYPGNYVA